MSRPIGYLPKLRALSAIQPASTRQIAQAMGIGFETSRTARNRLEAAGFVVGVRTLRRHKVASVLYSLSKTGAEALASGVEPVVPRDGYTPSSQRAGLNEEALSWRELHMAFCMGRPIVPRRARVIDRGMDREPEVRA